MNIESVMHTQLAFKPRGIMRNLHPTTMPLWALIKGIQSNADLAATTAQGRQLEPEAFKAWKPRNLMSVYLAPKFRDHEGRADAANVCGYTGLAGFDFDSVADVAGTLDALHGIPQVVCAAVSASGHGVWCAARCDAATASEYEQCFADGVRAFSEAGIAGIDVQTFDVVRARFVASSPECWWRQDVCGPVPAFQPVGDLSLLRSAVKAGRRKPVPMPATYQMSLSLEVGYDEARRICAEAALVDDGDRNNAKAEMCGRLKALAERVGVDPKSYVGLFVNAWDDAGSTHKKTISIANRLLLGRGRKKEAKS